MSSEQTGSWSDSDTDANVVEEIEERAQEISRLLERMGSTEPGPDHEELNPDSLEAAVRAVMTQLSEDVLQPYSECVLQPTGRYIRASVSAAQRKLLETEGYLEGSRLALTERLVRVVIEPYHNGIVVPTEQLLAKVAEQIDQAVSDLLPASPPDPSDTTHPSTPPFPQSSSGNPTSFPERSSPTSALSPLRHTATRLSSQLSLVLAQTGQYLWDQAVTRTFGTNQDLLNALLALQSPEAKRDMGGADVSWRDSLLNPLIAMCEAEMAKADTLTVDSRINT